jgi:dihydroflavonol-4-reductase
MSRFLVTNATGYISLHIVDQLLKKGYFVRGSVRNVRDKKRIAPLLKYGKMSINQLELIEADLLEPETWIDAVENIDIIIHLANPSPIDRLGDEQGLIEPSVSGTLNVLNAAIKSSVKKVIINSLAFTFFDQLLNNETNDDEDDCAEVS